MEEYQKILLQNKAWAQDTHEYDEEYFTRLAATQTPQLLWIGCSDSRVSTGRVTDTMPGEMFVHRNIANLVVEDDINVLSVVQYAVEVLKVRHIIVCGHYGCGGVKASMSDGKSGQIAQWLSNIEDVYERHRDELDALSEARRVNRLVELNTIVQVKKLAKLDIIRRAWAADAHYPTLHGWIFDLGTGLLDEILYMAPD
ncbi:MAG: carbonic anhydrase [Cytophagaceae bacterium]|nr:carbonic anhydrase [Cytophagaceae bacterium]